MRCLPPPAPLTGDAARRTHGIMKELGIRRDTARAKVRTLDKDSQEAAALRGKATAYSEAISLLERLEKGRWIRGKYRFRRREQA